MTAPLGILLALPAVLPQDAPDPTYPADGAGGSHWAYSRPPNPTPPPGPGGEHPIDAFVRARLEAQDLRAAPRAAPGPLLRRLSLDLTGLPPHPDDVLAFAADPSDAAWGAAVERLLDSPAFGEHWARWWLDLARYADTKGYEKDAPRNSWRWRDWVIDAFQEGMPLDRFTVEQLAGDLLPGAGAGQRLATGFHRNTMTNDEGGTDDEEFRVAAVVDRVNTTMQVWMGLTMGCAQCHDHKVEPFTQREYYSLFAFFDQTADRDREDDAPLLTEPSAWELERLAAHRASHQAAQRRFYAPDPRLEAAQRQWEDELRAAQRALSDLGLEWSPWEHSGPWPAEDFDAALEGDFPPARGAADVRWTPRPDWSDGRVHTGLEGERSAHFLRRRVRAAAPGEVVLALGSDDGLIVTVAGREVFVGRERRAAALGQDHVRVRLEAGETEIGLRIVNDGGPAGFAFEALPRELPSGILALALRPPAEREPDMEGLLRRWWRVHRCEELAAAAEVLLAAQSPPPLPGAPVLEELPPDSRRTTHVLHRGNFLAPGEVVEPGVPAVLHPLAAEGDPPDRLDLARWIVSDQNPLTARVLANRIWAELFGVGIVSTSEDFGLSGEAPSHPELLDWLALELRAGGAGWDLRAFLRTIVTSETYRRAARISSDLAARDPGNRLLARGPRFRVPAEVVRDQALAVAGLLSDARHGPPVFPPQPEGLWRVVYSDVSWQTSAGEDRYRRGLYTFWRRTQPHPSTAIFDAPSRESCTGRRHRSNTPLQALVTLNDPVFVEAAQALARRVLEHSGDDDARLERLFLLALARLPDAVEREHLGAFLEAERRTWRGRPGQARRFATDPLGPLPPWIEPWEAAAWTALAQGLLNLDEVLTKG